MADLRLTCKICGGSFASRITLTKHGKLHEQGKVVKVKRIASRVNFWVNSQKIEGMPDCLICGQTRCSSRASLRLHYAQQHSDMLDVMKAHNELMADLEELRRWANLGNGGMLEMIRIRRAKRG